MDHAHFRSAVRRLYGVRMTNFWQHASVEEKLAQVDGGIECQMTSAQVAKNCGCSAASMRAFAYHHDRSFKNSTRAKPWAKQAGRRIKRRRVAIDGSKLNHKEDFEFEDF